MTLLAAVASGLAAYALAGLVSGDPVRIRWRRGRRPRAAATGAWLQQAGTRASPTQFRLAGLALGALGFAAALSVTATPAVAVPPALAAALAPRLYLARRRAQRLRQIADAWPDGLREIVAGIAAGLSLPQAVSGLATTGPEPLRRAFGRFPLLVRMLGFAAALEVVKDELADPASDRVIEVLLLAHERGGRIVAEVLRDLAEAAVEDARTSEEIATNALEQKINARAVLVLPWLVLLFLTATPGHFRDFYRSAAGLAVVAVAGLASVFGMWLIGRLSREPIEQRVLAGGQAARRAS